jgi:hypothetical protein
MVPVDSIKVFTTGSSIISPLGKVRSIINLVPSGKGEDSLV